MANEEEWGLDYYGEEGCCLSCYDAYEGCLCFACKCRKCSWYANEGNGLSSSSNGSLIYKGHCTYFDFSGPEPGKVLFTLQENRTIVKLEPYLEKKTFFKLVTFLRGFLFRFDVDRKEWYLPYHINKRAIPILEQFVRKCQVPFIIASSQEGSSGRS